MLDFKKHSLNEYLQHVFNGSPDSPLILGHPGSRWGNGEYMFTQDINVEDHVGKIIKARGIIHPTYKEFCIIGNDTYYHSDIYRETISFKNFNCRIKTNKKGERKFVSKEYNVGNRVIKIDFENNEFSSVCWSSHTFKQRIMKNGIREYSISFPFSGCELYERYNKKGICTKSFFHFPYNSGLGSIQLNMNKSAVKFLCNGNSKSGFMFNYINLPELKDASIVNLYNEYNCFYIDLMIPSTELYNVYQYGLEQLRKLVQEKSENAPYDKVIFSNMLDQINENTIKYEA